MSGGVTFPTGDVAKASDRGPTIAVGFNHVLSSRYSLVTEVHHSAFLGGGRHIVETTDVIMSRISLGVERQLTASDDSWRVAGRLLLGLTRFGTDPVASLEDSRFGVTKINADVFSLSGGLQLQRRLSPFSPFIRIDAALFFIGDDMGRLRGLDSTIDESGPALAVPVQAGVRLDL